MESYAVVASIFDGSGIEVRTKDVSTISRCRPNVATRRSPLHTRWTWPRQITNTQEYIYLYCYRTSADPKMSIKMLSPTVIRFGRFYHHWIRINKANTAHVSGTWHVPEGSQLYALTKATPFIRYRYMARPWRVTVVLHYCLSHRLGTMHTCNTLWKICKAGTHMTCTAATLCKPLTVYKIKLSCSPIKATVR